MGFNLIIVIVVSFVPLIMIIFGNMFLKNPPKKPNWAFGYRTKFSVKSQETWDFSQNLIGKYWKTLGLVLLPLSNATLAIMNGSNIDTIGKVVGVIEIIQCVFMIGATVAVSSKLKKVFDANGVRK